MVETRVFLGVGIGIAVLAAVYWFTAYEDAGTTLLVLATVLLVWPGAYLWLRTRPAGEPEEHPEPVETYLPHASPWPFAIGLGAFLTLNGVLAGGWFFVPGVVVLLVGVGGFIRQTRLRA